MLEAFPTAYVGVGFFRSVITVHTDEYRKKEYSYSFLLYFAHIQSKGKIKKLALPSKSQSHCLTLCHIKLYKASRIIQKMLFL